MTLVEYRTPAFRWIAVLLLGLGAVVITISTAARLPRFDTDLKVNDQIQALGHSTALTAADFISDPGEIGEASDLKLFYLRQDILAKSISASPLLNGQILKTKSLHDSLRDLPLNFWIQVLVGSLAFLISAWVWALRHRDRAAQLFFASGVSTLLFTFSAAIYSTRELAIASQHFSLLANINVVGAASFGIFMMNLFLIYPSVSTNAYRISSLLSAVFGCWTIASIAGQIPPWAGVNLITLAEMLCICLAILRQYFLTKGNLKSRSALTWLGLSVLLGAGFFIALNAVPLVFGQDLQINQGLAFVSFVFLYLGLAAGISRYRLFDVGEWAFRFLYYGIGTGFFFVMDLALIYSFGIEKSSAFALSLVTLSLTYFPLKEWLKAKWSPPARLDHHQLLNRVLKVTLAPNESARYEEWKSLLKDLFDPLELVETITEETQVRLSDEGSSMIFPRIASLSALRLSFPSAGRKLFNRDSQGLAIQLLSSLRQAESNREAYDRGGREERKRITQDLHDDVGASLLSILSSADEMTKHSLRKVISDIRNIVNEMAEAEVELNEILADLRHETLTRLESYNISADWGFSTITSGAFLNYREHKALRSSVRELVSNIIRHSEASEAKVEVQVDQLMVHIKISDNGKGLDSDLHAGQYVGLGLKNVFGRIEAAGGYFRLASTNDWTCFEIRIPFQTAFSSIQTHDESPLGWLPRDSKPEACGKLI